jgi:hypothetical protein
MGILGRIKLSWFVPEWNIMSLLFYCVIVYPVAYMLVFRLLMAPVWDFISLSWTIGKWFASLYDSMGITPGSIPYERAQNTTSTGFGWKVAVKFAELVKELGNQSL